MNILNPVVSCGVVRFHCYESMHALIYYLTDILVLYWLSIMSVL